MLKVRRGAGKGLNLLGAALLAAVAPLAAAQASSAAAQPAPQEIVPLKTSVSYSGVVMQRPWSAVVSRADGSAAYLLTLEPTYWTNGQIQSLSLVLRKASNDRLLQKMTFTARELANRGYAKHRGMSVQRLGVEVQADVLLARVRPGAGGGTALEELDLAISVDSSTGATDSVALAPGRPQASDEGSAPIQGQSR